MLTFRQVRYFVAVAETRKISAAAVELGISQSAITVAIKELEASLGVTLIQRRVGGVSLAQDGQNFLLHAKNIEANVADAIHSMKTKEVAVHGSFRLGVTYTPLGYFLLPLLARFRRAYPNVDVEIVEMEREALEQALQDKRVDVALMVISNISQEDGLKSRLLLRSPRMLWISSAHRLNRRAEISLEELQAENFVQFTSDEADRSAARYFQELNFRPRIILRTTSMEAVRGMVATGAAVTILANLVYRPWSLDGGRVEFRPIKESVPDLALGFAWRSDKQLTEIENRFCNYLMVSVDPKAP